jgi:hypothetical protein
MKIYWLSAFLAAVILAATATAEANYQDGNALYKDMSDRDVSSKMFSLGYIVGVADASINSDLLCIAPSVTQGQLQDVVFNFLAAHPQTRNLPAHIIVVVALGEHWSCPKTNKRKNKS